MFDYILGLPMHALVIHAVVVLVPLSALVAIAFVGRPAWRRRLLWPTAASAVISGVSAFVAAESGQALQRRVLTARASSTNVELLNEHVEWGDRAKIICLVFMVVTLAACWFLRTPADDAPRRRPLEILLGVVVTLSAVAAFVSVALAGHAGSKVVWTGLG
ncbi:MAG: DUF2231 domain-containing protein [Terracoccus sp.]